MREQSLLAWATGIAIFTAVELGFTYAGPADLENSERVDGVASKVEFLEIGGVKSSRVTDMAVDSGGMPWVMMDNKVLYWTGTEFREPLSGPLSSGYYLAQFYGGPDRGTYATQKGEKEHEGFLYRLEDGVAEFLTTFYYDVSHDYPGVYVSKNGRLFNWGERFLAVYDGEKWSRIDARLSQRLSVIFDCADDVYFCYDNSLYCATASGQLQERACPPWTKSRPGQNRIVGALWAGSKALLLNYGEEGLFAFDLATGQEIDLREAFGDWQSVRFYGAFSLRDGGVWVLGIREGGDGYSFFHLSPSGKLTEIVATRGWHWDNNRCWQYPESILETADGTLLFGLAQDGIAVFRDNHLSRWGWTYGFADGVAHLHQDPAGNIWLPANGRIAKLRLGDGPPPLDSSTLDWQEFALARNSQVWEPESRQLAMFRADQPGMLSRWDGWNWTQQPMPFDTPRIERSATDDRGHLLFELRGYRNLYFDVGRDSVERFDKTEAMLTAAVAAGATEFKSDSGYQGIVITPEKQIWFGHRNYYRVYSYDGVRWNTLVAPDGVQYLFSSLKHGILINTWSGRLYRCESGQMVEVEPLMGRTRIFMIGEKYLQPYEREMIEACPGRYFPILRDMDKTTLFFDVNEFEAYIRGGESAKNAASVTVSRYAEKISVAASGGAWVFSMWGSDTPSRLFGTGVYPIEIGGTPLAGKPILDVKEDPGGGLWFLTTYAGSTMAYYHDQRQMELDVGPLPETCGRELVVEVSILPERMGAGTRIFSRVDDGAWVPADADDGYCIFRFPASGEYDCQITALRMGGRIGKDLSFRIRAEVPLFDTDSEKTIPVSAN